MNDIRTISRPAGRVARRCGWLVTAVTLAPALASAQQGDVFASDGGAGRPFAHVAEEHSNCAGLVHDYWAKTDELDALFQQRKQSVNPEATQIGKEINEKAKERGEVGDQILDCVKNDVVQARPPLQGGVDQTAPFELRAEKDQPEDEPVFRALTPQLDAREPPGSSGPGPQTAPRPTGGSSDPGPQTRLTGTLTPGSSPGGSGEKVIPRSPPRNGSGGGRNDSGNGDGTPRVETSVTGTIVGTGGGNAPGGTVPNDFTRNYEFAQGMLQGVDDAGRETGGRLGQLMIATSYIVRGDFNRARSWLGLVPGQSVTIADLQKDLEEFSDVINGDPQGTDLNHSFESGRTVGKKLTDIFMGKYIIEVPPLQPPVSSGGQLLDGASDPFGSGATPPPAR